MSPQNKAFVGAVKTWRGDFISLLKRANIDNTVYASKHFCERVVERNLETVQVVLKTIYDKIHPGDFDVYIKM